MGGPTRMTVIFAGAFDDCAVIGADTRRADQVTGRTAGEFHKIVECNGKVSAAKAGYGPDADGIWEVVKSHPRRDHLTSDDVAELLRAEGTSLYQRCLSRARAIGERDPGLYVLVAGVGRDGAYKIHALNFGLNDFVDFAGPGRVLCYGPRVECNDFAFNALKSMLSLDETSLRAPVDRWAVEVTRQCNEWAPNFVDFPVSVNLVVAEGTVSRSLGRNNTLDPLFNRRIAPR
ncbi:hypothetical protein GHK50_33620 [Sinorhizobium medicae]|uniref:Uncharacterized protein n=1 Tax=Sinorhizobium medicae TaxID=110321 RepID=A0A6G1WVG6_9HYPH|nr:hypothetical protein [Sinorhizobium medicae]MQX87779.1 hypothetical protein [Sinorhizobium medicae]